MKNSVNLLHHRTSRRPIQPALHCALASSLFALAALAEPITYTGFTISHGQLGSWSFQNARVYLTFKSDTANVQFVQVPDPFGGTVDTYINQTGDASVTIVSGEKVVTAHLAPQQILVSLDLGDTAYAPHSGARGIGFGSFSSTIPGGIDPVYPLGIEDGTLDWGDYATDIDGYTVSPEILALPLDLQHNLGVSGRAWRCSGFPDPCLPPPILRTDKGDFLLSDPYSAYDEPITAGFFIAQLGKGLPIIPSLASSSESDDSNRRSAKSITYNGYVISDVTLGNHHYSGAQVYLSFDADASAVQPLGQGISHGYINSKGNAHVTVISGAHIESADFKPGQIYVYYDVDHASVGFGSRSGGNGYPLSITANQDEGGLVGNSSVGAASDLALTPADPSIYSPATADLITDLRNATVLSGAASSCTDFDPTTSLGSGLPPIALHTTRGDFYLFEPYTVGLTTAAPQVFSVNWGIFWSEVGGHHHD
jgi:hypothetical protein